MPILLQDQEITFVDLLDDHSTMHRLCKYGDSCCTGKDHHTETGWCQHMRCLWLPQSWIVVDANGIQKPRSISVVDAAVVDATGVEPV